MTKKIEDPIVLESGKEITSATTVELGSPQRPVLYTNFLLHLSTQFAGATSDSKKIQYIVQYSKDGGTTWCDYLIGHLGSLIYNKNQGTGEIKHCISGTVEGQDWQVVAKTWDGTWDATNKVTLKADVEFYSK